MTIVVGFFTSHVVVLCVTSFFLGSIPFAWVIARLNQVDLRTVGSGNVGATNVYRALGVRYAGLVFALDFLKGAIPTWIALNHEYPFIHMLVGGLAIAGHTFSPFLRLKGGKGAATGLGVLATLGFDVFLLLATLATLLITTTRMVALATIVCALVCPLLLWLFHYPSPYWMGTGLMAILIVGRHWQNIQRMIRGEEHTL
ncbi:glycerol-3-phosphate 1-O-acyltransferase [bacterium]|nr:glycerol-3-phosphate 1-O-acyltransferase [bacterium]